MADRFGIYVHWPYCLAKCPYCDFNSHVSRSAVNQQHIAASISYELKFFAEKTNKNRVDTIFFGGGTPSLMAEETVRQIIENVAELWELATDAEITLEANPTSVESRKFTGYRAAGVNRVSVGVQALNDKDLAMLGRRHTAEEALQSYRLARNVFPRSSFDLIYARPEQTIDSWREELKLALEQGADHMSLYQLTIEEGTAFGDLRARGRLEVPEDQLAAELYQVAQEMTAAAGLERYEVSNHARPGHECRHNMIYWGGQDYAGVGPGAHSRISNGDGTRSAWKAISDPNQWLTAIETEGHAQEILEILSGPQQAEEYLLIGLRRRQGIDLRKFLDLRGHPLESKKIAALTDAGMLHQPCTGWLAATPDGFLVLDRVVGELI